MKKFLDSQYKLEIVGSALLILGVITSQIIDHSVDDEYSSDPITQSDREEFLSKNPKLLKKFQAKKKVEKQSQLIANKSETTQAEIAK